MLTIIVIISLLQVSLKTAYDLHEGIRNNFSYSTSVTEIPPPPPTKKKTPLHLLILGKLRTKFTSQIT